jgi:predicted HicB family RNase H-like nuclease
VRSFIGSSPKGNGPWGGAIDEKISDRSGSNTMMQYKGYFAKIEFDADAKILHGEVVGIRDVVTFQATSTSQIEREFHASIDDYLAFCKKRGEAPDKPYSGQFIVRADPTLHRKAASIAEAQGKSLNTLVVEALGAQISDVSHRRKPTVRSGRSRNRARRAA